MENNSIENQGDGKYFPVSLLKFSLMSICTLGLYQIYWSYKNWRFIKDRDRSKISPVWRSFFHPLWYFSLLKDIDGDGGSGVIGSDFYKALLAVILIVLSALWRLPDPYWLVSAFTFVLMLPAVSAISEINRAGSNQAAKSSHRPLNFVAYLIGGSVVLFAVFSSIGFFPSTMVMPGSALWERDLQYLRTQEILGKGEEILFFYSLGVWSIREDGQFISNEYVTSYQIDTEDDSLYTFFSAYEDIEEIDVQWSDSWLEDTVVTITDSDGNEFGVWISAESGGDKKFVKEMKRLWKSKSKKNGGEEDSAT